MARTPADELERDARRGLTCSCPCRTRDPQWRKSFPERDLILFLTFCAILATLVLQGLTLGPLISALHLKSEDEAAEVEELETRLEGAHAAVKRLEQLDGEQVPTSAQERTHEQYEERIRRYEAGIEAGGTTEEYAQSSVAWRAWQRELIKAEREAVISKRDRGEVGPEVMSPSDSRPRLGGVTSRGLKSSATGDEANS